jgi:hypothetical protein
MKHSFKVLLVLLVVAVAVAGIFGCSKKDESPTMPKSDQGLTMSASHPLIQAAMAVQNRHTPKLMSNPQVVGTATGISTDGKPCILVLVETAAAIPALPASLDGVPVVPYVSGKIVAMKAGGVSHTARQTRPIQLGVSGGNSKDLANGYCCGGTLGSLVTKNGVQYILSNSHVFCGDIAASSKDPDVSKIGDGIDQPGLIDVSCQDKPADYVANVSTLTSLKSNTNVDCALAQVISGMVRTDGAILEIGTISHNTVAAAVGKAVKKSGRTTGLTRSTISGLNATVTVGYTDECNGKAFNVTYTGQIIVTNRRSAFLNSGDSGSLMVEDVTTNPRAIGLLFAGSSTTAVANPINAVLTYLGVTMVGI